MEKIIIVGFGGHAKSVSDCIERMGIYDIVGYTDYEDRYSKYQYLGTDENLKSIFNKGIKKAVIGIGYLGKSNIRENIFNELKLIGYELPIVVDPSAVVSLSASIGEGTFIGKGAVINSDANIGKAVIINTKAVIEHDCVIESFTHIAVGAVLCGQVRTGKSSFIGANTTIIQSKTIDEYSVIPAGITVR